MFNTVPPAVPPDPIERAITESSARFEAKLRAELGMMANMVPMAKYVSLYSDELRLFVAQLPKVKS